MCFVPPMLPTIAAAYEEQRQAEHHANEMLRKFEALQPPKPLPWYYRDPIGALAAAVGLVLAGYAIIKIMSLL